MYFYITLLFLLFLNSLAQNSSLLPQSNDFYKLNQIDHFPDLTTIYTDQDSSSQLEAFKSNKNDQFLKNNQSNALKWYSIGIPTLIETKSKINKNGSLFHFTNERFYTHVEMLNNQHRKQFVDEVEKKYKIKVGLNQIENLIISSFICELIIFDGESGVKIRGKVSDFKNFPLRLNFEYSLRDKERKVFKNRFEEIDENKIFELKSEISFGEFKKEFILSTEKYLIKSTKEVYDRKLINPIYQSDF
jgi:hypothetical protein